MKKLKNTNIKIKIFKKKAFLKFSKLKYRIKTKWGDVKRFLIKITRAFVKLVSFLKIKKLNWLPKIKQIVFVCGTPKNIALWIFILLIIIITIENTGIEKIISQFSFIMMFYDLLSESKSELLGFLFTFIVFDKAVEKTKNKNLKGIREIIILDFNKLLDVYYNFSNYIFSNFDFDSITYEQINKNVKWHLSMFDPLLSSEKYPKFLSQIVATEIIEINKTIVIKPEYLNEEKILELQNFLSTLIHINKTIMSDFSNYLHEYEFELLISIYKDSEYLVEIIEDNDINFIKNNELDLFELSVKLILINLTSIGNYLPIKWHQLKINNDHMFKLCYEKMYKNISKDLPKFLQEQNSKSSIEYEDDLKNLKNNYKIINEPPYLIFEDETNYYYKKFRKRMKKNYQLLPWSPINSKEIE